MQTKQNAGFRNSTSKKKQVYFNNYLTAKAIAPSTGKNHEKCPQTFRKKIKFATRWYTKLCNQFESIASIMAFQSWNLNRLKRVEKRPGS